MYCYPIEYDIPRPDVTAHAPVFCVRYGPRVIPKTWRGYDTGGWPKTIAEKGAARGSALWVTPELFRAILFYGPTELITRVPIGIQKVRDFRRQIHAGRFGQVPLLARIGSVHGQLARFWYKAKNVRPVGDGAEQSKLLLLESAQEIMRAVALADDNARLRELVEAGRSLFALATEWRTTGDTIEQP